MATLYKGHHICGSASRPQYWPSHGERRALRLDMEVLYLSPHLLHDQEGGSARTHSNGTSQVSLYFMVGSISFSRKYQARDWDTYAAGTRTSRWLSVPKSRTSNTFISTTGGGSNGLRSFFPTRSFPTRDLSTVDPPALCLPDALVGLLSTPTGAELDEVGLLRGGGWFGPP